jgi:hypothetical protein
LAARGSSVFPENRCEALLIEELKSASGESDASAAFDRGLDRLEAHFRQKGAALPFQCDRGTRQFDASDLPYVKFIAFAVQHRGAGKQSRPL